MGRFEIKASAPSNIALLKYWGKMPSPAKQWPANSSFSMTLNHARTFCNISLDHHEVMSKNTDVIRFSTKLSNPEKAEARVREYIGFLRDLLGFEGFLHIETKNTFPESCGIASSASSFASLCVGAVAAWTRSNSFEELQQHGFSREKLAKLAVMGSGSAGRSFWGGFVKWNKGSSSDDQSIQQVFSEEEWQLHDLIFILDSLPKKTSSSDGHKSAWTSPLFQPRLAAISDRLSLIEESINDRDIEKLGFVAEMDAIDMHAVMMTSQPSLNYLSQKTLGFISWIRETRKNAPFPAFFTLDAGSTVHLITESHAHLWWLEACSEYLLGEGFGDFKVLKDHIGKGPELKALESQ